MKTRAIGIDLGGTTISFIDMVSPDRVFSRQRINTPATKEGILDALVETVRTMAAAPHDDPPVGIGLAVAGRIDIASNSVIFSPNLPFSDEYPLGAKLADALGMKVVMDNDANAAAIGEKVFGAARGVDDFIAVTLGTGIGTGIFVRGSILHGHDGAGGEGGHIVIDPSGPQCNCGNRGCLETFASGLAIGVAGLHVYGTPKTAKEICAAAVKGDKLAKDILRKAGERLGDGLVSMVNLFNPRAVFFTGSLADAPKDYFDPAFRKVREKSFGGMGADVRLEVSPLRHEVGVIGAAALPLLSHSP